MRKSAFIFWHLSFSRARRVLGQRWAQKWIQCLKSLLKMVRLARSGHFSKMLLDRIIWFSCCHLGKVYFLFARSLGCWVKELGWVPLSEMPWAGQNDGGGVTELCRVFVELFILFLFFASLIWRSSMIWCFQEPLLLRAESQPHWFPPRLRAPFGWH